MPEILFHYERVNPSSWAYLSSFLMLALFFKFSRIWSVRNLDLLLLISLAPGLLLVHFSRIDPSAMSDPVGIEHLGFLWLFGSCALLLTRLLIDSAMVRRPLLEPNLNAAGLLFLSSALMFFLMANVVTGEPTEAGMRPARPANELREETTEGGQASTFATDGPGYWLVYLLPRISTQTVLEAGADEPADSAAAAGDDRRRRIREITSRLVSILSHSMIVLGVIAIGYYHFQNFVAGVAAATMYLMLPYTALWTGDPTHALPSALLVAAVLLYRRPVLAGMMIGLASGTSYYPVFLLPLWCSYYWDRGVKRFATGVLIMLGVLVASMAVTGTTWEVVQERFQAMFGLHVPKFADMEGVWSRWSPYYRYPILAAFVVLALSFVFWPVKKNLATLISCTGAVMVAAQFWHAHSGGLYVAWYLPLLLLTIYRPNLEDRDAVRMVSQGWTAKRKRPVVESRQAG